MGDAEPGWYDDGAGRRRWWDGTAWTDQYLDDESAPPPPRAGTAYDPKMDAAAAPGLQPKKSNRGVVWGCLGCLGIPLGLVLVWIIWSAASGPPDYDANNGYEAIAQCEARIEEQLRAPSTAEFNSEASGSGTWTVRGTVDAENGFGAKIRSSYQCTVEISGDTATTTIDQFG